MGQVFLQTNNSYSTRLLSSLVSKKMNGLSLTQPLPEFSEQRYSCSSDTVTQKRAHLISSRLVQFRVEICAAVTIRSILDSRGCRDYPECLVMCSGKHFSKSRYAGEGEEQLLLTFAATLLTRNISTAECNSASLSNLLNMGDNNWVTWLQITDPGLQLETLLFQRYLSRSESVATSSSGDEWRSVGRKAK